MIHLQRVTPIAGGCFVLALAVALIQPTLPAFAQRAELNEVRNEIARLQREVSALRRQIARGGTRGRSGPKSIGGELPPTLAARMEVRLSQLEGQVSRMTGKIEEINHGIKQIGEKLDRAVTDIELRLSALEKGKPVAGGRRSAGGGRTTARRGSTGRTADGNSGGDTRGSGSGAGTAGGTTGNAGGGTGGGGEQLAKLPDGKPAEQYQYAMSLLRTPAITTRPPGHSRPSSSGYPNGTLTGNAVYWLGESYYVRGKYREAAIHFAEGFKKFPKSPKASANLLKARYVLRQAQQAPRGLRQPVRVAAAVSARTPHISAAVPPANRAGCAAARNSSVRPWEYAHAHLRPPAERARLRPGHGASRPVRARPASGDSRFPAAPTVWRWRCWPAAGRQSHQGKVTAVYCRPRPAARFRSRSLHGWHLVPRSWMRPCHFDLGRRQACQRYSVCRPRRPLCAARRLVP